MSAEERIQMIEWTKTIASLIADRKIELGTDLRLIFDHLGADLRTTKQGDISTVSEFENLAQAIVARLSTEEGELNDIGHSDYGSRLYEVIGEINNELTRRKIRLIVQECLAQEPRIKKVVNIDVLQDPIEAHKVNIELTILTQKNDQNLTLTVPFSLEE
jgi:phage baseplate assembly protein W